MNTAEQIATLDRRRAILAALAVSPAYSQPDRALREQLGLIGYQVSLDRLATDLAWLAEQGLIDQVGQSARLTDRGLDVVLGRANTPGVRRPEPGEL